MVYLWPCDHIILIKYSKGSQGFPSSYVWLVITRPKFLTYVIWRHKREVNLNFTIFCDRYSQINPEVWLCVCVMTQFVCLNPLRYPLLHFTAPFETDVNNLPPLSFRPHQQHDVHLWGRWGNGEDTASHAQALSPHSLKPKHTQTHTHTHTDMRTHAESHLRF